jgi:vacuolar-type H+-ATPase subunit I/STV1
MAVFGKPPEEKMQRVTVELIKRVNDNTKRLRDLEARATAVNARVNSLEESFISLSKNIKQSLSNVNSKITNEDVKITKMQDSIQEIIKQLKQVATKSHIEGLEELIEIYNPLKSNFVTREEVENMIKSRSEEKEE